MYYYLPTDINNRTLTPREQAKLTGGTESTRIYYFVRIIILKYILSISINDFVLLAIGLYYNFNYFMKCLMSGKGQTFIVQLPTAIKVNV